MATITIESYKSFEYFSVSKVVERFPTGEVKRTIYTGKFIKTADVDLLPEDHIICTISTKLTKNPTIEMEMFPIG